MKLEKRMLMASRELVRDLMSLRRSPDAYEVEIKIAEARLSALTSARRAWKQLCLQMECCSTYERRLAARRLGIPLTARERQAEIERIQAQVLAHLHRNSVSAHQQAL